ncbi:hypothetical protein BDQ17DRAFT_1337469 [Cyathus striatus]|nr:hypothetical protein BDQ17DRAFT_1337469 [Cyathus striatus]
MAHATAQLPYIILLVEIWALVENIAELVDLSVFLARFCPPFIFDKFCFSYSRAFCLHHDLPHFCGGPVPELSIVEVNDLWRKMVSGARSDVGVSAFEGISGKGQVRGEARANANNASMRASVDYVI